MMLYRPQLAVPGNASTNRQGVSLPNLQKQGYAFDVKIDGVRVIAYWDGTRLRLINRNGVDVTHRFPELSASAPGLDRPMVLDGEVCAVDGSFESTAIRDKQTSPGDVAAAMHKMPIKFLAFDILELDGNERFHAQPWLERRQQLDALLLPEPFDRTVWSPDASFYDAVKSLGMEGVICKQVSAPYQQGRRSPVWIKYKTVRRVTCVATGYEPGTGARKHFGAMHLAMIDPRTRTPVGVGRVGTGFSEREILELKRILDSGQPIVVEIEALNTTKTGQLRFPVFRGIRTDLSVVDATIDQLAELPRC
jgi:bifunctional non-homologous end joining protein LigD